MKKYCYSQITAKSEKMAQSNNNFTFSRPLWLLSGPFQ
ncbi:DNA-binding protein [Escherichia coli]|uniref:DNA-binding protein n=1 Tax=Escherichia coli TaxID=562 RepID=A0A246W6B3_ECOLX|nr:DNA-binding protein [Escherichia coli]AXF91919.1 DNA-binding protein [Escherichia coli APEC O2-211]EFO2128659.1 DNA-binding protein [Escherichia coli O100]ATB74232.1 DNA-binding protein [Escherichia coli]AUK07528.1 DNA-binding protein [Escherichia coli]